MLKSQKHLVVSTFFRTFASEIKNKGMGDTIKYILRHTLNGNVNFI